MTKGIENMVWNVYYEDFNGRKVAKYNILNHGSFVMNIKEKAKQCRTKEELSRALRSEAMYWFWSKSEWETIIEITKDNRILLHPWIRYDDPKCDVLDVTDDASFDWKGFAEKHTGKQRFGSEAKIDVFDQLEYVWDDFVSYCWENLKTKK